MRLNELTEALDNPYPYTWYERSNDTWTAYAELNSERSSDGRDDEDATLRIIADRVSGGDDWDDDERVVPTIWELSFMTGYKTHKTGAGDQFRIFATVVAAFTDWWKQMGSKVNDIDELEFTADKAKDGKSRAVLYARFAKKFAQMTGFNLETKQDSYQDVFTFVNPQSNESVNEVSKEEFDAIQNGYVNIEFDKKWWPLNDDYPLIKHIGKAIGATSWTSWGKVGVPWSETEMIGGGGTYMLKGDFGHILLDAAKSFRPEQILMAQISTSNRGDGVGVKVMNAIKSYADQKGLPITIYKVTNKKFFDKFSWLTKTGEDTYEYNAAKVEESAGVGRVVKGVNPQSSFAEDSVTEEVSLPQDIFHMKNRLLKVKKITDAMGNRPIMFRSFVYDADRIGKIIKKVTNDSGRKIKTGSNQKQQEVLQKLGVNNPTFANLAAGKHADVRRTSLEDHGVAGLQNIFIPISNEIYYSDAVEDLGMGRSTGGKNISLQSDFDVDKAVASYKKGWPPAGFDNEIIVDTDKYYLLNLQSFLLELTSPDIKDQIKRLKREYDKSYSSNASKNQVDDILKDLFKTKIMTYSNISRWIESVAIPFVDMLGASSVQENFKDGKVKGKSRPGRVKRSGASCNGSVTELRAKAKKASGEKAKMYHWCANMKAGKK
tara:strand:- start:6 stop:1985 length:1980 start_codon:yes stop_codon:yes gene_type:complete